MRIGWYTHSANDTLNPNRLTTTLDYLRGFQICSQIIRHSTKQTAEPDLATEWNASDDLKTWRFKIRKGVEFHNGKSLTVQDCIYSLNRHRGENSDSIIKPLIDTITDMKADGDWLVIELEAPNADFPMYLGVYQSLVVPDGFEDFDNLVGTGPFVMDSFRPGVGMLAKKNPNYHIEGYPHVDEAESFGIGDTAARRSMHCWPGTSTSRCASIRSRSRSSRARLTPRWRARRRAGTGRSRWSRFDHPPTTVTSARRCGCCWTAKRC